MNQGEIVRFIKEEVKRQGLGRETMKKKTGDSGYQHVQELLRLGREETGSIGFKFILSALNTLGFELVLRRKRYYIGQRTEARDVTEKFGFHPRVDLFDTPEEAANYVPSKPCDVYEINSEGLDLAELEDAPYSFVPMYHYHQPIEPKYIDKRKTVE